MMEERKKEINREREREKGNKTTTTKSGSLNDTNSISETS